MKKMKMNDDSNKNCRIGDDQTKGEMLKKTKDCKCTTMGKDILNKFKIKSDILDETINGWWGEPDLKGEIPSIKGEQQHEENYHETVEYIRNIVKGTLLKKCTCGGEIGRVLITSRYLKGLRRHLWENKLGLQTHPDMMIDSKDALPENF